MGGGSAPTPLGAGLASQLACYLRPLLVIGRDMGAGGAFCWSRLLCAGLSRLVIDRAGPQSSPSSLIQRTDKLGVSHPAPNYEGCGDPGEGFSAVSLQKVTFKLRPEGPQGVLQCQGVSRSVIKGAGIILCFLSVGFIFFLATLHSLLDLSSPTRT